MTADKVISIFESTVGLTIDHINDCPKDIWSGLKSLFRGVMNLIGVVLLVVIMVITTPVFIAALVIKSEHALRNTKK